MNPLRTHQLPQSRMHSPNTPVSNSLVNLEFSCWDYSCSCASLPPADEGCAVTQNDARRKSGCIGVEHRLLPFEALKKVTRP